MDLPLYHNQRWTKNQENDLLLHLAEGMPLKDISTIQSRKVSALQGRLGKISYDLNLKGTPIIEINSITKLSIDDIQSAIRRYDSKKKRLTINNKLDMILDRLEKIELTKPSLKD